MGWFWNKKPASDPDKATIESLVRECAPGAKVIWDGLDLRVEGVERVLFDEVGRRLWDYRNGLIHLPDGGGKTHVALFVRTTLLDPEEVEMVQRDRTLTRAAARVTRVFNFIELLVPRRLADEEIGDAMELIDRLALAGCPRWQIYLKAASAVLFVLLNAVREVSSSVLGKKNKA
jgi:hypothetical protein